MFFFLSKRKNKNLLKVQSLEKALTKLSIYLTIIFALHIGAMMIFEAMTFKDAWWLTMTSITTVGYGDLSAKSWIGRLATTGFIYMGGIFVLADFVSKVTAWNNWKNERKLKGTWRWKLKDHIVIIGSPESHPERFFGRIVDEIRGVAEFEHTPIQLLTNSFADQLPERLRGRGVVHYCGTGLTDEELAAVTISSAKYVVVLSNSSTDPSADAAGLDILSRLHDVGFLGTSIMECVSDANRGRAFRFGADAVIRPARGYPEMIVRAMTSLGSEKIIENLFSSHGSEICRVELEGIIKMPWMQVVSAVVTAGAGIPIGYLDGEVIKTNPPASEVVHSSTLFVIMEDQTPAACAAITEALVEKLQAA